jgi:hypothetical protein
LPILTPINGGNSAREGGYPMICLSPFPLLHSTL